MSSSQSSNPRKSRQRDAIRDVFDRFDNPLSVEEIHEAAREVIPRLGMATVYRTIKLLLDDKSIVAVELPGHTPRYEKAGKSHHHHFLCHDCDKVFDLPGCALDTEHLHTPNGFTVDHHEIVLEGTCSDCNEPE